MKFKFLKWKIDIKTKKLNADEKIGYLANEMIKEIIVSGRKVDNPSISSNFGSLNIWMHRIGTDKSYIEIENSANDWSVVTKPTFDKF